MSCFFESSNSCRITFQDLLFEESVSSDTNQNCPYLSFSVSPDHSQYLPSDLCSRWEGISLDCKSLHFIPNINGSISVKSNGSYSEDDPTFGSVTFSTDDLPQASLGLPAITNLYVEIEVSKEEFRLIRELSKLSGSLMLFLTLQPEKRADARRDYFKRGIKKFEFCQRDEPPNRSNSLGLSINSSFVSVFRDFLLTNLNDYLPETVASAENEEEIEKTRISLSDKDEIQVRVVLRDILVSIIRKSKYERPAELQSIWLAYRNLALDVVGHSRYFTPRSQSRDSTPRLWSKQAPIELVSVCPTGRFSLFGSKRRRELDLPRMPSCSDISAVALSYLNSELRNESLDWLLIDRLILASCCTSLRIAKKSGKQDITRLSKKKLHQYHQVPLSEVSSPERVWEVLSLDKETNNTWPAVLWVLLEDVKEAKRTPRIPLNSWGEREYFENVKLSLVTQSFEDPFKVASDAAA